jgi:hypothetical protein
VEKNFEYMPTSPLKNSMPQNAFSIHAHFYQPPREDPFSGIVPNEHSAAPYPNWNERIYAECYRPNVELRNFEQISFNVGPTLFAWLQAQHPETSQQIVTQDHANLERYGVGNAMAQSYNHSILPLATLQDKITQVYWGYADFHHRFGRQPQGMWLPETGVDYETLEVLVRMGIQFTILAPWQANIENLDVTEPYTVNLSADNRMTVFFYQRDISTQVSFDPAATMNADLFAKDVLQTHLNPEKIRRREPQLLLVASDGELYGHHQQWRERFLARLVDGASGLLGMISTYPALWLQEHLPRRSVAIRENTSWSCHHGVERWKAPCECTPGGSAWKTALRSALDRLANDLDQVYLEVTRPLIIDPWQLRNRYIHVMLGQIRLADLLGEMSVRTLKSEESKRIELLLEAQRERQRMFTSCGWFFQDFDRIEPQNNVAYAAKAVCLTNLATGLDFIGQTSRDLHHVISPQTGLRGDQVFKKRLQHAEESICIRKEYTD